MPRCLSAAASSVRVRGRTASSPRQISRARSAGSCCPSLSPDPTPLRDESSPFVARRRAPPRAPDRPRPDGTGTDPRGQPSSSSSRSSLASNVESLVVPARASFSASGPPRDCASADGSPSAGALLALDRARGGAASQPRPVRPRRLPVTASTGHCVYPPQLTSVRSASASIRSRPVGGPGHSRHPNPGPHRASRGSSSRSPPRRRDGPSGSCGSSPCPARADPRRRCTRHPIFE